MTGFRFRVTLLFLAVAALGAGPEPANAQGGRDFMFHRPDATLSVRAGYALPSESSDIFDFIQDELTLDKGAFQGFVLAGDLSARVTERIDVVFGVGYTRVQKDSEFRSWVDLDDLPIEQSTLLSRMPVTAGFKYYLMDRGRSIGRFVWIPEKWTPYVGASGGWTRYRFEQTGDFVDYQTLDIFTYDFASEGWAPTWALLSGVDWTLNPRVALRVEARYSWGSGDLGVDFEDFDPIDLGGLDASLGFAFRL